MRNTLLGSCLLAMSIGLAGCDDSGKKIETESPPLPAPEIKAPAETKSGAMGGPAAKPEATTTPPAETATPPEKKEEPPK